MSSYYFLPKGPPPPRINKMKCKDCGRDDCDQLDPDSCVSCSEKATGYKASLYDGIASILQTVERKRIDELCAALVEIRDTITKNGESAEITIRDTTEILKKYVYFGGPKEKRSTEVEDLKAEVKNLKERLATSIEANSDLQDQNKAHIRRLEQHLTESHDIVKQRDIKIVELITKIKELDKDFFLTGIRHAQNNGMTHQLADVFTLAVEMKFNL